MELAPGYLVSKHVRLLRELKRGGMGSIWVAEHLGLQTQVAVKFMAAVIAKDAESIARFEREATSAAQIKSPHVVHVHDYGLTPDGMPYMVMELLHGEDLSVRLKREGTLPLDTVAQIVSQVCRALGKAHSLGIVHRDIKPGNLFLLDAEGDVFVKILDFGVAKMADDFTSEITTTGVVVGTLAYMSPDQLLSAKTVDHRADLWSLAIVAYQSLTGDLPFSRDGGLAALCRAIDLGSFRPPSACGPGVPPAVDAWFERALAAKAETRFGSAKEMFEALQIATGATTGPLSMPSIRLTSPAPPPAASLFVGAVTVAEAGAKAHPRAPTPEDAKSRATMAASTFAGTASAHSASKRRSGLLPRLGAVAVIGTLGAGALVSRSPGLWRLSRLRPAPQTASAMAHPPPRDAIAPALPAGSLAIPTASAPVSPTATAPVSPTATAPAALPGLPPPPALSTSVQPPAPSGAPSGVAGTRARGARGGPRTVLPEKDYGF